MAAVAIGTICPRRRVIIRVEPREAVEAVIEEVHAQAMADEPRGSRVDTRLRAKLPLDVTVTIFSSYSAVRRLGRAAG